MNKPVIVELRHHWHEWLVIGPGGQYMSPLVHHSAVLPLLHQVGGQGDQAHLVIDVQLVRNQGV